MNWKRRIQQDSNSVLVRSPSDVVFRTGELAKPYAEKHWEYAALSALVYKIARERSELDRASRNQFKRARPSATHATEAISQLLIGGGLNWSRWADFPSADLLSRMRKNGLFLAVFERDSPHREIAVVFEGTNFRDIKDLKANLHWFLRFIPKVEDQYTLAAREVTIEFHKYLCHHPGKYRIDFQRGTLSSASGDPIRIVTTGHSLGGGLAQYFAYTYPQFDEPVIGPKVAEVFAFDPSPVTGWSSAPKPARAYNSIGLRINRIYEFGEFLSILRLFTSRLARFTQHPSIWEYRYNFDLEFNVLRNHSIERLAHGLRKTAASLAH